jgi:predicted SAM-dependent methyltransferase
MIKLHLGCGKLRLENFINIDIYNENADIKLDITNLSIFNNNKVDEIYICHVLEHIKRNSVLNLILEFNRVLKIGGKLRISVPDFDKVVFEYNTNKNLSKIIGFLNGGQKNDYDVHYINYNMDFLSKLLVNCGFEEIEIYNPYEFLIDSEDDYSKAYLPDMDKSGLLMSLNVICKKTSNKKLEDIVVSEEIKKILKIN